VSKDRQKARAAREAARRAEVEEAARQRAKRARRKALVPAVSLPNRRKRYGALPLTEVLRLVVIFLMFQAVVWFFVPALAARISLAVLSAACLGVYVTTRRSTTR
jgi:hypothetical protein